MSAKTKIIVRIIGSSITLAIAGRMAWALNKLILAGEQGCTPIDAPAPRWSAYVHALRKIGIVIETITEPHGGPYPGSHARYVLRSAVEIVEAT